MDKVSLQWVEDLVRSLPEEIREEIRREVYTPELRERIKAVIAARI
jgi:hypothetical protein